MYCIWVIRMASRYKFSEEQIKEIEQARKDNKDKRAEARLKASVTLTILILYIPFVVQRTVGAMMMKQK